MADQTPPAEPTVPAEPLPTPASPADDQRARIIAAIRRWRDEAIANGPIARATACWNHLDAALEPLAAAICKEI
jgi:hypothetical protein